jgi:hypothetical protein
MKLSKFVCGLLFLTLATIVPTFSTNLYAASIVTNGGFETGDFTGWTGTGNTSFNGVQCPGPGPSVFQGKCSAFFGPVGSIGGISQALSTVAGQSYQISFALSSPDGGTPASFSALFGGNTLINLTNPPASTFVVYNFTSTAGSASTTLAFNFRDDPGFMFLDAVSVDAVPEPTSLLLLGPSLVGIAFAIRKRVMNSI